MIVNIKLVIAPLFGEKLIIYNNMVNWQNELKKYTAKKLKSTLGIDVTPDQIDDIEFTLENVNLSETTNNELLMLYAFTIMDETFEQAKMISDEFNNRGISIQTNTNNVEKSANIVIYNNKKPNNIINDIKMRLLPDGMVIDFEKQNF